MKTTRKLISISIAVFLVLVMSSTASAAGPKRSGYSSAPTLTFSGTTANCSIALYYPGKNISAELVLTEGDSIIASWTQSGMHSVTFNKTATVQSGHTYTLSCNATADGAVSKITPVTRTCP